MSPSRLKTLCVSILLVLPIAVLAGVARETSQDDRAADFVFDAAPAARAQASTKFYNGLPDAMSRSGRFVNVTRGLSSLGDTDALTNVFNIEVRIQTTWDDFELQVFDGDMGDTTWDRHPADPDNVTFRLFIDADRDGVVCDPARSPAGCTSDPTDVEIYDWPADEMPDDGWCTLNPDYIPGTNPACLDGSSILQETDADGGDGYNYYHLLADWDSNLKTNEQNNFKVAVEAQEFVTEFVNVPFLLAGTTIGFEGFGPSVPLPQFPANNYDGAFSFFLLINDSPNEAELWDGDLDRDTDSDDPNSPARPPFQHSAFTRDQGAFPGAPPDDSEFELLRRDPPIVYDFSTPLDTPAGSEWTVTNSNPSGDKEWERFKIQTSADGNEDVVVPSFPDTGSNLYRWDVRGADSHNTLFFNADFDVFPLQMSSIGDFVWRDDDLDGIQDVGEPGLEGVTVRLYADIDGDGVLSAADNLLETTTTDANGFYLFSPLVSSDYLVVVPASEFEAGGTLDVYHVTNADTGSDDAIDSDGKVDGTNGMYAAVALPAATHDRTVDFGVYEGQCQCVEACPSEDPDTGADIQVSIDDAGEEATIRVTMWDTFLDNAYGSSAGDFGWPGGNHKFRHVYGSDNLHMQLTDGNGDVQLEFEIDLLAEDGSGGFVTAGVDSGPRRSDGSMITGAITEVLRVETSPSYNYVTVGWTDESRSPTQSELDTTWSDYLMDTWYEVTVDLNAFGSAGFGDVLITSLHASPSKTGTNQPCVQPCTEAPEECEL